MQPGASSLHTGYNFSPHFEPQRPVFTPPHAVQYHAPQISHEPSAYTPQLPVAPAQPAHAAALNNYIPDATITRAYDHKSVGTNTKLRAGDVVEVNRPGHQTELAYANSNGVLRPLNESTINHLPPELRAHVAKVGGPSYFAHELHNRLPTLGVARQFSNQHFSGPNRPLI